MKFSLTSIITVGTVTPSPARDRGAPVRPGGDRDRVAASRRKDGLAECLLVWRPLDHSGDRRDGASRDAGAAGIKTSNTPKKM